MLVSRDKSIFLLVSLVSRKISPEGGIGNKARDTVNSLHYTLTPLENLLNVFYNHLLLMAVKAQVYLYLII